MKTEKAASGLVVLVGTKGKRERVRGSAEWRLCWRFVGYSRLLLVFLVESRFCKLEIYFSVAEPYFSI